MYDDKQNKTTVKYKDKGLNKTDKQIIIKKTNIKV